MKRVYIPIIVTFLFFSSLTSAQDWVSMMKDPKANVHDVQKAFNQWYSQHKKAQANEKEENAGKEEEEDGNYELFKRWEWLMVPRTYPTGNKPDMVSIAKQYQDYLENNSREQNSNTHRVQSAARWAYAGISNVPQYGDAGRINRVRIDPTNSNIIYACAPSGGLWKSINGGTAWSTKTDQLPDLATSDVAIDPTNTNIMYLATGDGDGIGGGFTTPSTVGVLKSTDGGNTWVQTSLYFTLQISGQSQWTVNELLINPNNHNVVFAATSFGLYYTSNAGISWNEVLNGNIKDIAFEPSHPAVMYATNATGRFFRSSNGGQTFSTVTLPSASAAGRMALAVTPADSNYVYVLADNASDFTFLGLWLSKDRGQTFTLQSNAPNLLGFYPNGGAGGQGWYTLSLAASPTNSAEVIVGGVNVWRSTNEGVNWTLNAFQGGGPFPYVHADIHHLIYLNGTTYFAGCDGGVYKTSNSGSVWSDLSNGLEIAEQYSIGLSASNSTMWLTGWQDNGTNLANAGNWKEVIGGDGMVCFIDYSNNNNMYGETFQGGFQYSSNGGANFGNIAISSPGELAGWVTPWMQDPKSANTLFSGLENVWKSTNKGSNWSKISSWGSGGNSIVSIAVAPSSDQYIYAATTSLIEGTSNGGTSWTNISSGVPTGITCIVVDPNNPLRLWVTISGYSPGTKVYQSINGGTSWTNISAGLPNLPANCIVYQKGGVADAMYVGTDMGVYYRDTVNTGGKWVSYNEGLPNVIITDLKIYSPSNILRAATYGRGTWQIATYTPSGIKPTASFKAFPRTICAGTAVQFTDTSANSPTSWNWTLTGGTPSSSTAQNPTVTYSTAGTYSVKLVAINSNGSDSVTTTNYVKVNPLPPAPTITQTGLLLSVTPSNYPFYQWYFNNTFIAWANQNQLWMNTKGNYKVIITDSNGCSNNVQFSVTVLTGINEISVSDEVNVFPNPTNGNLNLVFNLPDEGDYNLAVTNVLGQTMYTDKIHLSGKYAGSINMANYGKGMYFLSITGTNTRIVKKITVY